MSITGAVYLYASTTAASPLIACLLARNGSRLNPGIYELVSIYPIGAEAELTYLSLLNLEHLLVFARATLDRLVKEEVGNTHTNIMPVLAVSGQNLVQLQKGTVGGHTPAFGEL